MPDYFHKEFSEWEYSHWMTIQPPYNLNINWTVDRAKCFYCKTPVYYEPKMIKDLNGQVIGYLCSACAEKIEVIIKKKDEVD